MTLGATIPSDFIEHSRILYSTMWIRERYNLYGPAGGTDASVTLTACKGEIGYHVHKAGLRE